MNKGVIEQASKLIRQCDDLNEDQKAKVRLMILLDINKYVISLLSSVRMSWALPCVNTSIVCYIYHNYEYLLRDIEITGAKYERELEQPSHPYRVFLAQLLVNAFFGVVIPTGIRYLLIRGKK